MRLLAEPKHITLQVEAANDALVEGDEQRLGELLIVLIDNAIKYSDEGAAVAVKLAHEGKILRLTVTDTGHGIPPEALPHVFDRFYRVDKARSREQGGTGLGLAIARWIVEQHHGHIALSSVVGHGTEVTVDLPALTADDTPMEEEPVELRERAPEVEPRPAPGPAQAGPTSATPGS